MQIPDLEELTGDPEVREQVERMGAHLSGDRYGVPSLTQLEKSCEGDDTLSELLSEVVRYGIRYASSTVKYLSIDWDNTARDDVAMIDGGKKRAHDAAIDAINVLARTLKKMGRESGWIGSLTSGGRPAFARFALIVAFDAMHQEV